VTAQILVTVQQILNGRRRIIDAAMIAKHANVSWRASHDGEIARYPGLGKWADPMVYIIHKIAAGNAPPLLDELHTWAQQAGMSWYDPRLALWRDGHGGIGRGGRRRRPGGVGYMYYSL
jgi:hypothetical protein